MLLSIHVPKAAGNSFREALMASYGSRIMRDYGDWAGFDSPDANRRRAARTWRMRARRDELNNCYDAIHGHFIADKYLGLFDNAQYIAFFRNPYQQAMAHYHYLRRNTNRVSDVNQEVHPEVQLFIDHKPTLLDYLEWPMYRDHQSQFLGSLCVDDLAFVGISEQYAKSLELFKRTFGRDLGPPVFANTNEERGDGEYVVDSDVRLAVKKYRAHDLETYARAKELFERKTALTLA